MSMHLPQMMKRSNLQDLSRFRTFAGYNDYSTIAHMPVDNCRSLDEKIVPWSRGTYQPLRNVVELDQS